MGYVGKVVVIVCYEDEVLYLLENGVDKVFNFFIEVGFGFVEESFVYVYV